MTKTFYQSQTLEDRVNGSQMDIVDLQAGLGVIRSIAAYTDAHTLVASDNGKLVQVSKATAAALTVPQDSDADLPIGFQCQVQQTGAGAVTVTAGTGATLQKAAATAKILAQYGLVTVTKVAADTWAVNGELAAS
jgi:hypothetical protein